MKWDEENKWESKSEEFQTVNSFGICIEFTTSILIQKWECMHFPKAMQNSFQLALVFGTRNHSCNESLVLVAHGYGDKGELYSNVLVTWERCISKLLLKCWHVLWCLHHVWHADNYSNSSFLVLRASSASENVVLAGYENIFTVPWSFRYYKIELNYAN